MDILSNKLNKCRSCLVENNSQLLCWTAPLETANYESITYLECFQMCTRLDVHVHDQLPQTLCFQCAAELRDAYEFIKKATQAHQTLLMKQEYLTKTDEDGQKEASGFEWVAVQKTPDNEKCTTDSFTGTAVMTAAYELSPVAVELTINVDASTIKDYDSASLDKLDCSSISGKKDESDLSSVPKAESARVKCVLKKQRKQLNLTRNSLDKVESSSTCTSTEKDDSDFSYAPEEEPVRRVKFSKKRKDQEPKSMEPKLKSNEMERLLCHVCPSTFKSVKSLRGHELTHEENRERNYTCEHCGKAFFTTVQCKKHSKIHNTNRPKQFQCQQCDKSFLYERSLKTHMFTHTGDTLECKICKKVLLTETSYRNHNKTHDIDRIAAFQCDQCQKSFLYKKSLQLHMQIHKNGLFRCDQCDKLFFHKYSLDTHLLMHTGKTIPCEICGKRFPRSCELKSHMRTHSKDTPFKCQYCDKAFSRIGALNKHELQHEGYRYTCKNCGKEYTSQASLLKHKQTHSGITMKCSMCGKGFNEKFKMKRHIAGVHKIEMDKTEDLIQKVKTKREYRGFIIDETYILN